MERSFQDIVDFIRVLYARPEGIIPLHAPVFSGNEKKYVLDCIDSTYISYVGNYVNQFEEMTASYLEAKKAVAMVNGTVALQIALKLSGVKQGDLVITQALTFVATANAIIHAGAEPVFIDCEPETLGMSPEKLEKFIKDCCSFETGGKNMRFLVHKRTRQHIAACVPVHIYGHPVKIQEILKICNDYGITVVEDAAEAIGSTFSGKHMGTFGLMGVLSYNGNKTITTGGGGMIVTNDETLAARAKHITTTAKRPHPYEFFHDEVAYNYRLTNVQAAIGCAQMEKLDEILNAKRKIAQAYESFFRDSNIQFFKEKPGYHSNYWLNSILFENREQRDAFLEYSNAAGIMTRPAWILMNKLPMYKNCQSTDLRNAHWIEDRLINLPSGVVS